MKAMRLKVSLFAALAAVAALATALTITPTAGASSTSNVNAIPVSGTTSTGGTFNGTLDVSGVAKQAGHLVADGTLTGTATNAAGNTVGTVTDTPVAVPLTADPTGTCQILDLRIGTVHLDLLGLVVQLDPVHLNISAQPGSGNLLGNLLCSVSHLLDNANNSSNPGFLSGLLNPIVNLLNQIIGRL
jgi:hypothetical protein